MSIHYRIEDSFVVVTGHTFPHKEKIKAIGAVFDKDLKAWKVENNSFNLEQINHLCQKVGGGSLEPEGAPNRIRTPGIRSKIKDLEKKEPVSKTQDGGNTLGPVQQDLFSQPSSPAPPEKEEPKEPKAPHSYRVSEILTSVHLKILEGFPKPVWVVGELENFTPRGKGYFFQIAEAKDGKSNSTISVKATLWQSVASKLKKKDIDVDQIFADGVRIRALCQVSFYKDRGQVSLNVLDVDSQFTQGEIALAREKVLRQLRQEGIDKKNALAPLTNFPFVVGLVSADQSRAKSDFSHQLTSKGFCGDILFRSAEMQGQNCVRSVIQAIQELEGKVDLIVVTRGGGSAGDLRWFDDYHLSKTICECLVPVVAAIGHHEDTCVAEEVAFRREKTPTAAAEFILSVCRDTIENIESLHSDLLRQLQIAGERLQNQIQFLKQKLLDQCESKIHAQWILVQEYQDKINFEVYQILHSAANTKNKLKTTLYEQAQRYFYQMEKKLNQMEKKILGQDPREWIEKGWTRLIYQGRALHPNDSVVVGEDITAEYSTQNLLLTVKEVQKKNPKRN